MSQLTEKTLARIEREHIQPLSSWWGMLSNVAYWGGTLLSVIFSALAVTYALHTILEIDWNVFARARFAWYEAIFFGVPLFFLFLLIIFLIGSIILLQHTRRGYRYPFSFLLAMFVFISAASGFGLKVSPWDEPVERFLLGAVPYSERAGEIFVPSAKHQWSHPERGLLGGTVVDFGVNNIELRDEKGRLWHIEYQKETLWQGDVWGQGDKVKIIGEQKAAGIFSAEEIRLWKKSGAPPKEKNKKKRDDEDSPREKDAPTVSSTQPSGVAVATTKRETLLSGVPFTVQAPFGEWGNPLFQDGCEEAAITMAAYWLSGKPLTQEVAKKEIQALAEWQRKKFGQSVDTSAEDTRAMLAGYYGVTTALVTAHITLLDMVAALGQGKLVIVPADGRALKNPHFKQPGPPRHMVVVTGYDSETREFIVNDAGTRFGEGYRYKEDILYSAILDYATGNHVPVTSTDKVMLTVWQ